MQFYDKQGRHLSQTDPKAWSDLHATHFDPDRSVEEATLERNTERVIMKEHFPDRSLTQQQFGAESDINAIVKRAQATGILPGGELLPQYGDFTAVSDYHAAQSFIAAANSNFMLLPSDVRTFFKNDPALYLEFMDDPKNHDKAVELGLLTAKAVETPNIGADLAVSDVVRTPPATPVAKKQTPPPVAKE